MFRCLPAAAAVAACLLAACGRDTPTRAAGGDAGSDLAALPQPEANGGSVTGFDGEAPAPPRAAPAAGETQAPDMPAASVDAAAGFDLSTPGNTSSDVAPSPDPATPPPAMVPAAPPGPGALEAAAVVRAYYAAINARQYPRAYALWSDGGRASGQTGQQFAGGFSDTARVNVSTGEPGRVEGAAGSRYVTIPVAVEAVQADGSVRHYDGSYTLRRAVVDGASAEQREWRISAADLRQVR